eukprot:TRINITY_DN2097_c0_g1_i1.p1 TRINITY_DN2097_c0_g1~~TRINITY_DN2097_c0_g1_i1.p1  ORF type:complete len:372 (+),score=63.87 TRINITY_DN2097_c0_g1_i1:562-1677(+)
METADDEGSSIMAVCIAAMAAMLLEIWAVATLTVTEQDTALVKTIPVISDEEAASSTGERAESAVANALLVGGIFVGITLLLMLVYKLKLKRVMTTWLASCYFIIFVFLGWVVFDLTCTAHQVPYDIVTCCCVLWNFGVVGVVVIYVAGHPRMKQAYLILTAVILAWFLAKLPEWSTWVLLGLLTCYDLYSVGAENGVVRMLLGHDSSEEEDEESERPVTTTRMPYEMYRYDGDNSDDDIEYSIPGCDESLEVEMQDVVPAGRTNDAQETVHQYDTHSTPEGLLFETQNHELGLGDFTFYCLLTARSFRSKGALSSLLVVTAVLTGLLATLSLVHHLDTPLPALPLPILMGVVYYLVSLQHLEYIVSQFHT